MMEFQEIINVAAEILPEEYELRLRIEKGSAWFELFDSNGDAVELPEYVDTEMEDLIKDCVGVALAHAKSRSKVNP